MQEDPTFNGIIVDNSNNRYMITTSHSGIIEKMQFISKLISATIEATVVEARIVPMYDYTFVHANNVIETYFAATNRARAAVGM